MSRLAPVTLQANQPRDRPYAGGVGIAKFRRSTHSVPYTPEDFVGSTTEVHGAHRIGLSVLPDGQLLRDAIEHDPLGYLGPEHVKAYGRSTRLLVKLLNTQERLFVHYHPDDEFAAEHLHSPLGKTEAWIVIDAPPDGYAALGFNRRVTASEVTEWYREQDSEAMLAALNRLPLKPGDTVVVPPGQPHALSEGLLLVELQQPTDLSLILEHARFPALSGTDPLLGLPIEVALRALRMDGLTTAQLEDLRGSDKNPSSLLSCAADPYFSATRIAVDGSTALEAGFSILIVLEGSGSMTHPGGEFEIRGGTTILTPFEAGPVEISGQLTLLRCAPPQSANGTTAATV